MSEPTIRVSRHIATDPDQLWSRIGEPSALSAWHPAIAASPTASEGGGLKRTCTLDNGAVIVERILEQDPAARRYRYAIVDSPLPIADYVSELRVEAEGEGARVTWSGSYEALAAAAEMEATIRGVYEAGLDALQHAHGG